MTGSSVTLAGIGPAGTAHYPAVVSISGIDPAGAAYRQAAVTLSEIAAVGVRHYTRTVTISEISVQLGDFTAVEGRVRYYQNGRWVPASAEYWWSIDHWVVGG